MVAFWNMDGKRVEVSIEKKNVFFILLFVEWEGIFVLNKNEPWLVGGLGKEMGASL